MTFEEISNEYYKEEEMRSLREAKKPVDWEQRRYEIAKSVMGAVIQLQGTGKSARMNNMSYEKYCAMTAIYCADALIEELKK